MAVEIHRTREKGPAMPGVEILDFHVWSTGGDEPRYVRTGDPGAAFLAYAAGDEVPVEIAKPLKAKPKAEPKAAEPKSVDA